MIEHYEAGMKVKVIRNWDKKYKIGEIYDPFVAGHGVPNIQAAINQGRLMLVPVAKKEEATPASPSTTDQEAEDKAAIPITPTVGTAVTPVVVEAIAPLTALEKKGEMKPSPGVLEVKPMLTPANPEKVETTP